MTSFLSPLWAVVGYTSIRFIPICRSNFFNIRFILDRLIFSFFEIIHRIMDSIISAINIDLSPHQYKENKAAMFQHF